MNTTTTPTPTRRKKYILVQFCAKIQCFYSLRTEGNPASLEARKKRRDLFLKIKKRTNSLFDRRKIHPPLLEKRDTRDTPTLERREGQTRV